MELDTYDENTKSVYFYVVKNDTKRYGEYSADVVKNHVSMTIAVDAGAEYKAKACGSNQKNDHMGSFETGEWSEYSSNVSPCPNTPSWISYYAKTSTEVRLDWTHSKGATSFEVQYTEYQRYFDSLEMLHHLQLMKNLIIVMPRSLVLKQEQSISLGLGQRMTLVIPVGLRLYL